MKIRNIFLAVLLLAPALRAGAVTAEEMEQARVIAAQAYLRYANNGSGYLDELKPRSMSELESKLKSKEKDNLKSFKAVKTPTDYASWDKAKLTEYWGKTFFQSAGLIEEGRAARNRVRSRVGAMTVSAPKPAEAAAKADEKAAEKEQPTAAEAAAPVTLAGGDAAPAPEAVAADSALAKAEALALAAEETAATDEPVKKESNHTWIYVAVLCLLVGVVIWLVVYASNSMKGGGQAPAAAPRAPRGGGDEAMASGIDEAEVEEMRAKFAGALTSKNEEISRLEAEIGVLRENLRIAEADVQAARREAEEARAGMHRMQQAGAQPLQPVAAEPVQRPVQPQQRPARTIYLGRVNAKGIFVRADRELNPGLSIYRLVTTDGMSGSFYVANDPTVSEMALLTPEESLAGGCVAHNITATDGMTAIVTENPGTAVFEGGCWRVARKARISYV